MKEQYIKQVEKELRLPRGAKKEVLRDLREAFASALEHGETERQVIERLGAPGEFAENTMEQLGLDGAARKRKGLLTSAAALAVAIAAFAVYAAARAGQPPEGAIGYADAMTGIRMEGAFGFDLLGLLLAAGVIAAAFAALRLLRTVRESRREPGKNSERNY